MCLVGSFSWFNIMRVVATKRGAIYGYFLRSHAACLTESAEENGLGDQKYRSIKQLDDPTNNEVLS